MSVLSLPEVWLPATAAEQIDYDLQDIVDCMPEETKFAGNGQLCLVLALRGIGEVYTMFRGIERAQPPEADRRFMDLVVYLGGQPELSLRKGYELQYDPLKPGGALHELAPTNAQELAEKEELLDEVVLAVSIFRDHALQRWGSDGEGADIVQISDWRTSN